jgi:hypothetical protein
MSEIDRFGREFMLIRLSRWAAGRWSFVLRALLSLQSEESKS